MSVNPKFDKALKRMKLIHDLKNADYSLDNNPYSNFELVAGITGMGIDQVFLVQIANKIARAGALLKEQKTPNHESLHDTRLDLAVYGAMWLSYFEDES